MPDEQYKKEMRELAITAWTAPLVGIGLMLIFFSAILPPTPGWEWASIYLLWH